MKCPNCGVELLGSMKICPKCKYDTTLGMISPEYVKKLADDSAEKAELEAQAQRVLNFLATTGNTVDGYKIVKYMGIKSGNCVLGTGFLSELSAGWTDSFGMESGRMGSKLSQVKETAIARLITECVKIDADAVIGVDTDIMTIGANMMVATATGTAVKLEKL